MKKGASYFDWLKCVAPYLVYAMENDAMLSIIAGVVSLLKPESNTSVSPKMLITETTKKKNVKEVKNIFIQRLRYFLFQVKYK